jgi:adenosylcobinamide kinase/adenosylcobinamide-phosphate guanylyltransferase
MVKALILGGARSGKSHLALTLGERYPPPRYFLATALPSDAEMVERIERHRKERGDRWVTREIHTGLLEVLQGISPGVVVLDCLTLYLAQKLEKEDPLEEIESLCHLLPTLGYPLLIVSNEVGLGIVPETPLGRRFRDLIGTAHRRLVEVVDAVAFLIAGIPLWLKGRIEGVQEGV